MVEMYVDLVVPDNIAITAFNTLKDMNFPIKKLTRYEYYKIKGQEGIFDKLSKVDILVNANKNRAYQEIKCEPNQVKVIVKDTPNPGQGILSTLQNRLGIEGVDNIEKGQCWVLEIDDDNRKEIAEKITKELLANENYQEIEIL